MVREDDNYTTRHHDRELIEGLSQSQNFSKLFLENSSSAMTITVVGETKTIAEKLKGEANA